MRVNCKLCRSELAKPANGCSVSACYNLMMHHPDNCLGQSTKHTKVKFPILCKCRQWGRKMLSVRSVLAADKAQGAQAADSQQASLGSDQNRRPPGGGGYGPYGGGGGYGGGGNNRGWSGGGGNSGSSQWANAAWNNGWGGGR
jgi:hypothetical protein